MDLIQIILIFLLFYIGFNILYLLRKKKKPYDPFKTLEMKVKIHCNKCGFEKVVDFKRFDYVFMKITDKRAKHKKCIGDVEITGIWYEYKETPEEKKWREYESRFR